MSPILLYDGVCGLCNRLVRFILRRDRQAIFRFAALQSPIAARILARHGVNPSGLDTVYVVLNRDLPDGIVQSFRAHGGDPITDDLRERDFDSVNAILEVASFVGFVAAGQTFVILVGGIDLSVPWVLNSAGILFAVFSLGHSGRAVPAVLLALGLGLAIGAVNGFCVAYLGVSAVVMTLAMNGIMEGMTLGLTKGLTCARCNSYAPSVLQDIVHKDLLGIPADLILWFGVAAVVVGRRRPRGRRSPPGRPRCPARRSR